MKLSGNKRFGDEWLVWSSWLKDLIFPKECLGCGQEGSWLCQKCEAELEVNDSGHCPICSKEEALGRACSDCLKVSGLDGLAIIGSYESRLLAKVIHLLKYSYALELREVIGKIVDKYFQQEVAELNGWAIVPLPLERKRYLSRGFNQAQVIGEEISRSIGNEMATDILSRREYFRPQVGLDFQKRQENVRGNFTVLRKNDFEFDGLILVDDVYTTGATLREACKVLKQAGYGKVWGLTLAHG